MIICGMKKLKSRKAPMKLKFEFKSSGDQIQQETGICRQRNEMQQIETRNNT